MLQAVANVSPESADSAEDGIWIEALPARVYKTPVYGDVPVSHNKLSNFVKNFNANVRGQEIATDFEHGLDPTKGLQASGWYRQFDIKPSSDDPNQMSLYAKIAFTDDAKKDIKDGKYKYFSLEWDDEYETDAGSKVPDVIIGGGLTNRPVAKRTMPINFSENMWHDLDDDAKREVNRILANATRIKELAEKLEAGTLTKDVLLSEMAAQAHSDPGIGTPLYASANSQPDPGFGQNVPRVSGDATNDDKAIAGQWRRDPLPTREDGEYVDDPISTQETRPRLSEGGTVMPIEFSEQQVNGLTQALQIEGEDALDADKIIAHAETAFSELKQFKASVGATEKERRFAEDYPEQFRIMSEMREDNLANSAKTFAEGHTRLLKPVGTGDEVTFTPTRNGLSALALNTIAEKHKKFAEGTGTLADFAEAIDSITNGGVIEFGEVGNTREGDDMPAFDASTAQGRANARKTFSEKVAEVRAAHAKDNDGAVLGVVDATAKASALYPELAEAYRASA